MGDFRKLLVWQKAFALELEVDRITAKMRGRRGALRTQLVRAVNSISAPKAATQALALMPAPPRPPLERVG
jgi:hypothetical protein